MPGGLWTARHCVFMGGVVTANSICRAGFLRKQSCSGKRARPLRLLTAFASTSPKGRGLGKEMKLTGTAKGSHFGGAGERM